MAKNKQKTPELWQIRLNIGQNTPDGQSWTDETATQIADFFEDMGPALSIRMDDETSEWFIEIICEGEPDRVACNARLALYQMVMERPVDFIKLSFEVVPDIDWLQHVHEQFPPRPVGRFLIHGSHVQDAELQKYLQDTKTQIPLEINAATAFGSGEHATTQGCLQAFHDLLQQGQGFSNILDLGCGSGILAIAAALTLPEATIIASDFDLDSVEMTNFHAQMNKAETRVRGVVATGFEHKELQENAPYDLIFANILASPLIDLAPEMAKQGIKDGIIILSGMLSEQSDSVFKAYEAESFVLVKKYSINGWDSLVVQRN